MLTRWSLWLMLLVALASCKREAESEPVRGMYYWRTVFDLSTEEQTFLKEHNVERLYVRYFDVVMNEQGEPTPNATIKFSSTFLPLREGVVPVVFITNDCMAHPSKDLAEKILARVLQMNETHDIKGVRELQIDCDWTMSTRKNFFAFLDRLRPLAREKGISLSATIRLHQLSQPVPPVDRGVLMVYNTGDVTRLDCHHPILDLADVKSYLRHLKNYDLPLSAAYPLFTWRVLFRRGHYVGIMHSDDDLPVIAGDSIVIRQPDMAHIMEARRAIDQLRHDVHHEVILYDLSKENITRLKPNEYETIFSD